MTMLTLIEKTLLIRLFYTNNGSALKALRKFRTKKKKNECHGPIAENEFRRGETVK